MRRAVIRLDADPERVLSAQDIAQGIRDLEVRGITVRQRLDDRDLTLTFDGASRESVREHALSACEKAFGTTPALGAVTFASRGSDEDALGVVAAFGVRAHLTRADENGEEVAIFTFPTTDRKRVPESRLYTALEAALNCEIRIRYA